MTYSLESYRSILQTALGQGYRFLPFSACGADAARSLYLRHDVDYSPEVALEVARVNAELGVAGTFCILLRSQVYNVLSPWSRQAVHEIHRLGQLVAFHASLSLTHGRLDAIEAEIAGDYAFLAREYPFAQPVFSWHNPTEAMLQETAGRVQVAGLTNTYATRFTREIGYLSDSNMRHSAAEFRRCLAEGRYPTLQLLLHPINWVAGGGDVWQLFSRMWPYVIRDREQEIRLNARYRERLPAGTPSEVWWRLSRLWLESVREGECRAPRPDDRSEAEHCRGDAAC